MTTVTYKLPAGYSLNANGNLHVYSHGIGGRGDGWDFARRNVVIKSMEEYPISWAAIHNYLTVDDDNNVTIGEPYVDSRGITRRIIPDSEIPDGGLTRHHTHFNTDTGKWELEDIEPLSHSRLEEQHDSDVAAAEAALCEVEIDLMHRRAVLVNLNPDMKAHANAEYADFDDCIDNIVDTNAEPAIARAWIKSYGKVTHPILHAEHVNNAQDFATAWLEHLNSRTKTQLGARRYEYNLCVFRSLQADRGKTSDRFLPRGVTIVKRKSTPAKAEEMTAAQVFAKVKALVSPAEGQPKRA